MGRRPLSPDELATLIAYLRRTPVWPLADELERARLVAWHELVPTRRALGEMLTIFGNLGGLSAWELNGRDKFRVSDAWPVLSRFDCDDPKSRMTVTSMIESERQSRLSDRALTVLDDGA